MNSLHTLPRGVKLSKTRKPAPRSVAVLVPLMDTGRNAVVKITVGKLAVTYFLDKIPSDFGDGFALTKVGAEEEVYNLNLSEEGHTCECKGFLSWGHCKHVDGVKKLREHGKV